MQLLLCWGCRESEEIPDAIAKIPLTLEVRRFDREFARAKPSEIPALKSAYPYLFPAQYPDSVWVAKLQDTLQRELLAEVDREFGDFSREIDELESLFRHIRYYFPNQPVPAVVTMTSDVDYHNRIILTDSLLLIGLDNYLGEDHRFYGGIERYIAAGLDRKYIPSDVAGTFARKVLKFPDDRSFLAQMVYYGKILYLKDILLPMATDAEKIGYTEEELAWAESNEEQIWRYFIEGELLFSTDVKLGPRFLDPAPFSKFRLELDNESPGRLGRFIGWKIVRAFMEDHPLKLQQWLSLPAAELFKRSNYKPKK